MRDPIPVHDHANHGVIPVRYDRREDCFGTSARNLAGYHKFIDLSSRRVGFQPNGIELTWWEKLEFFDGGDRGKFFSKPHHWIGSFVSLDVELASRSTVAPENVSAEFR